MTDSDTDSKRRFIAAFFDDLDRKAAFLAELWNGGRQDEAVTLCCCYLDGVANNCRWDEASSAKNFVVTVQAFGGEPDLALHSGLGLVRALRAANKAALSTLANDIDTALGTALPDLVSAEELLRRLRGSLGQASYAAAKKHLWKGSVAAIAYNRVRSPFVHELRGYGAVIVGSTNTNGAHEVSLAFPLLHRVLTRLLATMRARSDDSVKWFGHDYRNAP